MPRGRTESSLGLRARRIKAAELFAKGYSVVEVAREIQVTPDTASRYKKAYEASFQEQAQADPGMLKNVLANTMRALEELNMIVARAWEMHDRPDATPTVKQNSMKIILSAQDQRNKLWGLFGVKQEFALHVAQIREQQDLLIKFMTEHLCPEDRRKLEEFIIINKFAGELDAMPTAEGVNT